MRTFLLLLAGIAMGIALRRCQCIGPWINSSMSIIVCLLVFLLGMSVPTNLVTGRTGVVIVLQSMAIGVAGILGSVGCAYLLHLLLRHER